MAHGRFDNPIIAALAGVRDFFRKQDLSDRLLDSDRADSLTCLVTGANGGLGFAIAVDLARRGAKVIMACRRDIPGAGEKVKLLSGSELIEMRYLDLSKIDTINDFVLKLAEDGIRLDIIILNAGVALPESRKTDSGLEEMFLVNYLSNFILVNSLLGKNLITNQLWGNQPDLGNKKPRIIFVSSDSHRGSSAIDYDQFGTYEDYGVTKGMNYYSYYKFVLNTYATELSRRLNKESLDVIVDVICPGPVNSNIAREAPWLLHKILKIIFFLVFKSPAKAAQAVVFMALSKDYNDKTNEYLHMFIPKRMDEKCYLPEEGSKLWEHSVKLCRSIDPNNPFWTSSNLQA